MDSKKEGESVGNMRNDRETILARVREAVSGLEERAMYPHYEDDLAVTAARRLEGDRWEIFCERFTAVNGMPVETPGELAEYLRHFGYTTGYCDPVLWGLLGPHFGSEFTVESAFDRKRIDDYRFGITRGRGAIAETGSLVVTDRTTTSRLAALAPWVHVVCIRRSEIFRDAPSAVNDLGGDPNVIWITGPSKTADVEGILIEGVHGPGIQIALLLPEEEAK